MPAIQSNGEKRKSGDCDVYEFEIQVSVNFESEAYIDYHYAVLNVNHLVIIW